MRSGAVLSTTMGLALLAVSVRPAQACRLVELGFRPATDDLQIVVWIESAGGVFQKTVYMTDKTGRYGLGNRPGRFDFNSEWQWPYGRRTTTFPVWAGRSPKTYPKLVFQDQDDDNLSHAIDDSSVEPFYCRPMTVSEVEVDAMTCATVAFTDKGMFHPTETSKYPPRNDMTVFSGGIDHADAQAMAAMNDLDAISAPTPPADLDKSVLVAMPETLPDGDYVAYIEVSREFDRNDRYQYPSPIVPWSEYGRPYRGQPSVLWRVPFTIGDGGGTFGTAEYAGYGDPEGLDEGSLRAPDCTIDASGTCAIVHAGGDGVSAGAEWTFAGAAFTPADVGRTLTVAGAADASLNGDFQIAAVLSSTTVTTSPAPQASETFGEAVTGSICCRDGMTGSGALRLQVLGDS